MSAGVFMLALRGLEVELERDDDGTVITTLSVIAADGTLVHVTSLALDPGEASAHMRAVPPRDGDVKGVWS